VLQEVAHDTGNMSKQVESSGNIARRVFGNGCTGVVINEHSILVVIPLRVLLVRRVVITKFVLWTVAPKTDMPLETM